MAFAGNLRPGHGNIDAAERSYCARGVVCISAGDAAGLGGIAGFNEGNSLQDRATISGLESITLLPRVSYKPTPCPGGLALGKFESANNALVGPAGLEGAQALAGNPPAPR